jgi:hypothetical protein
MPPSTGWTPVTSRARPPSRPASRQQVGFLPNPGTVIGCRPHEGYLVTVVVTTALANCTPTYWST